jgi:hypothetical protein
MASALYNSFKRDIMNGAIDLDTDTIHVALVTSTYTQDIDAHTKFSDITNEVSGTGYTAGGAALASKVVSVDNTNDRGSFDAADSSWTSSSITARAAIIYKKRGGAASADELIAYIDFGANKTSDGGTFLITWHANGIILLT